MELAQLHAEWEEHIKYNLSESGCQPLPLEVLLRGIDQEEFLSLKLGYSKTKGPDFLREKISPLYPGSDIENILVSNGSVEANLLSALTLLESGDELIFLEPGYMQIRGLANALGADLKTFHLREELGWAPDLEELGRLISPRTKVIALCNPNNPTGAVLSESSMDKIIALASQVGSWILVDEVFRGSELDNQMTSTFWGHYDKVLVTSGLSKAYGLPGLRIGWVVGPKEFIENASTLHDYSTIATGTVNNYLAGIALEPEVRESILSSNRGNMREKFQMVQNWIEKHGGIFNFVPPRVGTMVFVHYNLEISSVELAMKLIHEKSVLVVPGDYFGMDSFIRIGYGVEKETLVNSLELIDEMLRELV